MSKKDRSDNYLMPRLEREHPAIFADWKAGKYASKRQALIVAELRKPPRPINILKNAWGKASAKDRSDFLVWAGAATTGGTTPQVVDASGRLLPQVTARIKVIMDRRSLTMGQVMREMGLKALNPSLANALSKNTRIKDNGAIAALGKWLDDNKHV